MKEALYILSNFVHQLQKERGCSSIYLSSNGVYFKDKLNAQFLLSDAALSEFSEGFERWNQSKKMDGGILLRLQALRAVCEELTQLRKKVLGQEIAVAKMIDYYAHKLISPLLQMTVEIALQLEGGNPTFVSSYNAFLQWKERIGLERAIGVRGVVKESFDNAEFLERIMFLLSEQENYCQIYMTLSNETQKNLVQNVLNSEECMQLQQLHELLKTSPKSEAMKEFTPEIWFDLVTAKIDGLLGVEKKLIDALRDKEEVKTVVPEKTEGAVLFGEYNKLIMSLPLFSGFSADNLEAFLSCGQLREFNKGKLLFLEGEQATRFYIVLKGWVKIFKGTTGGEETILQMLSAGDAIMESAVFLNTSFPVNAQIAEDAVLLSLPAPMLREQIKNNNILALNLLATMSYRSQGLIRQIEDTRLKSVDERIGWFLLQLLLDQGKISREIRLPYDKSLIASYLDMKRETFSRSLKRLKEKGFKIENDTVVIPNLGALCDFCDVNTAQICSLHGTDECPNTDCSESNHACA